MYIRTAQPQEHERVGELMVRVYSQLQGFPSLDEMPGYYDMLRGVGKLTAKTGVELLLAVDAAQEILGAVVYFDDMREYGSGGTATQERNAAGFRLLAVSEKARGLGVGKQLTLECIGRARSAGRARLVIHTTRSMPVAWHMYEALGFVRREDLDFLQGDLEVFGFDLQLNVRGNEKTV